MTWRKPGILISDLYLYSIKIQTNTDQNVVTDLQKIIDFFEIILRRKFFEQARPDPKGNWAEINPK